MHQPKIFTNMGERVIILMWKEEKSKREAKNDINRNHKKSHEL